VSGTLLAAVAGCHRPPSADVVATVNGKEILRADLEKYYRMNLGDNPQPLSEEQANIGRLNVLQGMIDDEIVQQRAAKLNLAASDEDVNAKLTEMKAPLTPEQFNDRLKQSNLTLDDLKRNISRQLTREKLLNKEIESKINVTDAEIGAYYAAHKADFNLIEPRYHLAWIVTSGTPAQQAGNLQNSKASTDAEAKKKIDMLHNKLDSGEDFGTVASQFSEDGNTSPNGGDMGFRPESQLRNDPEVFAAINKLKPDQYTDPMPLYDNSPQGRRILGYAIYRLLGRDPAGQRELSDPRVQQTIHEGLHEAKKQLLQNAYFEVLRDEAKVRNYFAEQIANGK
jgi:peptidyl-prolyl cis-trans isomerase SurA